MTPHLPSIYTITRSRSCGQAAITLHSAKGRLARFLAWLLRLGLGCSFAMRDPSAGTAVLFLQSSVKYIITALFALLYYYTKYNLLRYYLSELCVLVSIVPGRQSSLLSSLAVPRRPIIALPLSPGHPPSLQNCTVPKGHLSFICV